MDLTLCYAPMACSLVAYVNLTEAGAPFKVRTVNTGAKEQKSADYLAVNPKGKVPVLLVDGYPLTENVAIQQFIARSFPAAKLLPAGFDEFKAISLMSWFTSTIHPHLTPNARPENYCDIPEAYDGVKRVAQKLLFEDLKIAENLSFTPWHALEDQRPLGGINRARKVAYEAISKYRHERNGVPRVEP